MAAKTDNLLRSERESAARRQPPARRKHIHMRNALQQQHVPAMPKPFGGRRQATSQEQGASAGERVPGTGRHSSLSISQPAGSPGINPLGVSGFSKQSHQQKGKTRQSKTYKQNEGSQVPRVEMSRILISGKLNQKKMEQAQTLADREHPPFRSTCARFI